MHAGAREEVARQLEDLFASQNKGKETTTIPATFLRVTVNV